MLHFLIVFSRHGNVSLLVSSCKTLVQTEISQELDELP